ncbi:MAG: GAF domain-containing protein [Anaerolineales bacterium]
MSDRPIEQLSIEASQARSDPMVDALVSWLVKHNPSHRGGGELALAELADIVDACGAWLFVRDSASHQPQLHSACLRQGEAFDYIPLGEVSDALVERLNGRLSGQDIKEVSLDPVDDLSVGVFPVSYLLHISVMENGRPLGSAVLAFDREPALLPVHLDLLKLVSTTIHGSLHNRSGRHPREILTLQANLTGLIAKIIDPATDLNHLLSLTLEHTVLPLGASLGGIWLLNPKGEELELRSSLLRLSRTKLPQHLEIDQGLLGGVAKTCQPLLTDSPKQHPDFDPHQDAPWADFGTVLAIPLYRHSSHFGVLCLCWDYSNAVSDEELVIIENMADLASAFMANITLINQLSGYSTQQKALLEMSRQIALGLDLETTIARGLQWVTRLVGVEFGLLWLVDKTQKEIRLEASIGSGMREAQDLTLSLEDQAYRSWGGIRQPVVVRDVSQGSAFWLNYEEIFGILARDLIALPLESQGELIGVVLLINRVGGLTLESEPAMLATAADMIALAVGNARLHSQTLDLIEERERAHALALQAARLATVGRLTATLSHEINNPMQAIRGALTLAQEDIDDSEALQDYLAMCIQESDRVVDLIDKMRHVYLPQADGSGPVHLNATLQTVMTFAHKASLRQGVEIQMELAPDLSPLYVASDQIHLVLLSLILYLSDAVAAAGGNQIQVRTCAGDDCVRVEFMTQTDLGTVINLFDQPQAKPLTEAAVSLAFSQDIIRSLDGELEIATQGQDVIVSLELPTQSQNTAGSKAV